MNIVNSFISALFSEFIIYFMTDGSAIFLSGSVKYLHESRKYLSKESEMNFILLVFEEFFLFIDHQREF